MLPQSITMSWPFYRNTDISQTYNVLRRTPSDVALSQRFTYFQLTENDRPPSFISFVGRTARQPDA